MGGFFSDFSLHSVRRFFIFCRSSHEWTESNLRHIQDALLTRVSHGWKLWPHRSVRAKQPGSFFLQNLSSHRKFLNLSWETFFLAFSISSPFGTSLLEHQQWAQIEFSFRRFLSQLLKCPEQPVSPVCLTWPDMSESTQIHTWTPMTYVLRNSFYPSVNWKGKHYCKNNLPQQELIPFYLRCSLDFKSEKPNKESKRKKKKEKNS